MHFDFILELFDTKTGTLLFCPKSFTVLKIILYWNLIFPRLVRTAFCGTTQLLDPCL